MWSENPAIEEIARKFEAEPLAKFLTIPMVLKQWTEDFGGIKDKRVLDFGCGFGTTAAGVALLTGAEKVVGVDINSESRNCLQFLEDSLNMKCLPENLLFEEISPGQTTSHDQFDCIYSWSVFEHVDLRILDKIVTDLVGKLKNGGLFFVQISPLYFSPEGSHLWSLGYYRWEHLTYQTSNVEEDVNSQAHLSTEQKLALLSMYHTLNRVTADDLIERLTASGLKLVREQRNQTDLQPPEHLLRAYSATALSTFQIVALFQK